MLTTMRILPLTLLILAAMLFAACGGAKSSDDVGGTPVATDEPGDGTADGGTNDDSDNSNGDTPTNYNPGTIPSDLQVSNGVEVLSASSDAFGQAITSLEGGIEMQMVGAGMDLSIDADFAFQSPDQMYMSVQMSGDDGTGTDLSAFGSMEFLVLGDTYYINVPLFGGWIYMSIDELGLTDEDLAEITSMLNTGSAFDYQALVDGVGGVEFVGEEQLNGLAVLHYSVTVDAEDVSAALGGLDAAGMGFDQVPGGEAITGPLQMDIWVGANDLLPYKMTMDVDATVPGEGSFSMNMLMHIDSYNGDVNIPAPPADAMSFEEIFGGLFTDPENGGLGDLGNFFETS